MKSKYLIIAAMLLLITGPAYAQVSASDGNNANGNAGSSAMYFPNELTFDGFGTYDKPFSRFEDVFDRPWHNGEFGGGVGINYFITRYVGFGADTFWEEKGKFWKNVSGQVILRAPLGKSGFAPYIFGGGGKRFSPRNEWTWDGGLGLEYRFTRHVGVFGDIRYIWADRTQDALLPRAGLRFAF